MVYLEARAKTITTTTTKATTTRRAKGSGKKNRKSRARTEAKTKNNFNDKCENNDNYKSNRSRSNCGLAVFEPAEDFWEVGFLAVHEDAYAVDAAGYPEDSVDGGDHQDD